MLLKAEIHSGQVTSLSQQTHTYMRYREEGYTPFLKQFREFMGCHETMSKSEVQGPAALHNTFLPSSAGQATADKLDSFLF